MDEGIMPERELPLSDNKARWAMSPMDEGMDPCSELKLTSNSIRAVRAPIVEGKLSVIRL